LYFTKNYNNKNWNFCLLRNFFTAKIRALYPNLWLPRFAKSGYSSTRLLSVRYLVLDLVFLCAQFCRIPVISSDDGNFCHSLHNVFISNLNRGTVLKRIFTRAIYLWHLKSCSIAEPSVSQFGISHMKRVSLQPETFGWSKWSTNNNLLC
jgi:hypothetical protein